MKDMNNMVDNMVNNMGIFRPISECLIANAVEAVTRANAVFIDDNTLEIRYVKSLNTNEPLTIEEQNLIEKIYRANGFYYKIIFK